MSCPFCDIVSEKLTCHKIYEDEHTLAILDIADDVDGHILVIPKTHIESILDCDSITLNCVMQSVQTVSRHLLSCGYDGVNVLNASGTAADQSIPHLHFHLIPRRHGDGLNTWPLLPGATESRNVLCEKLTMCKKE